MKRSDIETLCHALGRHMWDGGDEDGYGGEYDVDQDAVDTVEKFLTKHGVMIEKTG